MHIWWVIFELNQTFWSFIREIYKYGVTLTAANEFYQRCALVEPVKQMFATVPQNQHLWLQMRKEKLHVVIPILRQFLYLCKNTSYFVEKHHFARLLLWRHTNCIQILNKFFWKIFSWDQNVHAIWNFSTEHWEKTSLFAIGNLRGPGDSPANSYIPLSLFLWSNMCVGR